jgi:16S rRNA (cytosine967-C5)-methyltransferase
MKRYAGKKSAGKKARRKEPSKKANVQPGTGKARPLNPRITAIKAMGEVLDDGKSLSESASLRGELASRELSQARHLAYGVLRWQIALAWLESQLLAKPLKSKDRDISRLLWLGLFQLWQDSTPDHAAINETTECARGLGKTWAVGMINAVLRRFQREQSHWLEQLAAVPEHWAHPEWLVSAIQQDWPDHWQGILDANNQSPPLWIRVNPQRATRADTDTQLTEAGFSTGHSEFAGQALLVTPAANVNDLPGFTAGHISVQDAAAQLAAGLLDVQEGMNVLDACAAPGGKTCHLLEQHPGIKLTALELYPNRLKRISENLERLGLECELKAADATEPGSWWDGQAFDRILLDAPCTAVGVIRRHPEIRHLRQPSHVQEAVAAQYALLQHLWPLLAPGGMLLYATCSVLRDENSNQIMNFLAAHDDAEEARIDGNWGKAEAHGRQILPGEQNMDGFYYALLQKRS